MDDGTCTETITIDNKNLTIRFINGAGVTIIDSGGAYPVATFQNVADSVLDGFTVTGADSTVDYAAGVVISNSSPTIENSIVTGNTSGKVGSILFDKCSITGNKATNYQSGAFWFIDDNNSTHTVNIINSTFSGNYAGTYGGAILRDNTAEVTITNSIVRQNQAGSGDYEINGTVTASYSDINQAGYEGNNNINSDPLFVSPVSYASAPTSSGDYHLRFSGH